MKSCWVYFDDFEIGILSSGVFTMSNRMVTKHEFVLLCFIAISVLVGSGVAVWTQRQKREPVEKTSEVAYADERAGTIETTAADADNDGRRFTETQVSTDRKAATAAKSSTEGDLVVEVVGAVRRPGVYRFSPGATVADAIEKAGGAEEEADFSNLNRAATLLPATRLTVPEQRSAVRIDGKLVVTMPGKSEILPQYSADWSGNAGGGRSGGLVNINTATGKELETLPRVGPKTAKAIMEYRRRKPFVRVEDIMEVSGIGPKTLEGMRPLITVN